MQFLDSSRLAPVGVFDSGIGGLSVVNALRSYLPAEDIIYFADSAHCPYGERDEEFILHRSFEIARLLIERGVKLLVVACNTACAVALDALRASFEVEIVGLEPAVKPAVQMTKTGRIAVFATPRTIGSARLSRLIESHAAGILVDRVPAAGWVDLVERGALEPQESIGQVKAVVSPAIARGNDVFVLGCTHYPFLEPAIRQITGGSIHLVDSGPAVAKRTGDLLLRNGLNRPDLRKPGGLTLLTTSADPEAVTALATRLLGAPVLAESLSI